MMLHVRVEKHTGDVPTVAGLTRRMHAEGLDPYQWSNNPSAVYDVHAHPYHKVIYVVSGSIVFELPDRKEQAVLEAGDRLELPAGTRHGAVVGNQGVVCLEGHQAAGT